MVSIYAVIGQDIGQSHLLLDYKYIDQRHATDTWLTYNVTAAVDWWMPALDVRVDPPASGSVTVRTTDAALLVFSSAKNRAPRPSVGWNAKYHSKETRSLRHKRSASAGATKAKKVPKTNACRRRPLYVNFTEINYDAWIVAPPGYDAYECVGRCDFPLADFTQPTKHAIIQSLVHGSVSSSDKVGRPCCVPIQLDPISLLYVDEDGVLTYKYNYEEMVVTQCGCR